MFFAFDFGNGLALQNIGRLLKVGMRMRRGSARLIAATTYCGLRRRAAWYSLSASAESPRCARIFASVVRASGLSALKRCAPLNSLAAESKRSRSAAGPACGGDGGKQRSRSDTHAPHGIGEKRRYPGPNLNRRQIFQHVEGADPYPWVGIG